MILPALACGDSIHLSSDALTPDATTVDTPPPDAPHATVAVTDPGGQPATRIDLGAVTVGQTSNAVVLVANTGTSPTASLELAIAGTNASEFTIDPAGSSCAGAVLAPLQTCTVTFEFTPLASGARSASLMIDAGDETIAQLPLVGIGLGLALPAAGWDYGAIEIAQPAANTFELDNTSTSAMSIDAIDVSGSGFALTSTTCTSTLAGGGSCQITVTFTPSTLGAATGQMTVTSGMTMTSAPLTGDGAHQVRIGFPEWGGTVTSSPAGIDCSSGCAALFDTDVVLTATPHPGDVFVGWSDPACGSSPTCTVAATVSPVQIDATFEPSTGVVHVTLAGTGSGEVFVGVGGTGVTCFASCVVATTPGAAVTIDAYTADTRGGFSGPCTSASSFECNYTAPSGSSAVTVTFTADPAEQWTRYFGEAVTHVAHDLSGNVIVYTPTQVYELDSAGNSISVMPGGEPTTAAPLTATDSQGLTYVAYDDANVGNVYRFLSDGTQLPTWDGSTPGWAGISAWPARTIAVDPADQVLALWHEAGYSGFQRTWADGSVDFTQTVRDYLTSVGPLGITASSAGRIAWWYDDGDQNYGFQYFIHVLTDDGAEVWALNPSPDPFGPQLEDASYFGSQLVIGGDLGGGGFVQAFAP